MSDYLNSINFGFYIISNKLKDKGIYIGTRGLKALSNIMITPLIAHWCVYIDG